MIRLLKCWIDEDIENIPPLSELAGRLGYSVFYVSKKFHEAEGISLREYITGRKLCQAADKLYTTTERIIDIAVRYDYSSQEAFSRAFKKVYGVPPAVYRRTQKPLPRVEKTELLGYMGTVGPNKKNRGNQMKLYVKQMQDWNYYGLYAEDVDEKYWDYFKAGLWWQLGGSFIKTYDNVADFRYCAQNYVNFGELSIKQLTGEIPAPWENALDLFIGEIDKLGVDWYIHGSVALALWGINVTPKDVNIIIANAPDFEKVRAHFARYAIAPIQPCDEYGMCGGGQIFMEAAISIWTQKQDRYDMSALGKASCKGRDVYLSSLEMLRKDNEYYGRDERVALIEEKLLKTKG
ncbi:MAG: AraC family transcriptional regulator [Clostridiales bacterium]|jgi:AraC-like DNA-binding protein|nr:AraC family transcriptional regulator [Clostridiales bacterium]